MVIERCTNEFIIRIPLVPQIERVQEIVNYFRYIELTSDHNVPQENVDALAREINKNWHTEHENRS